MMELVEFLTIQINIDERSAIESLFLLSQDHESVRSPGWYEAVCLAPGCEWTTSGTENVAEDAAYEHVGENHRDQRVLREVEAKRRILAEHEPEWRTVEWPHDQDGKGNALCCPRCQNAEHTDWRPAWGQAGELPEGFVAPYVLAPCTTLRLLALPYADHESYREEWKP